MSAPRTTGVGPRRPGWVIAAHQSRDMLRKRWVIVYTGLLMLAGDLLLRLAGSGASALVSLLNVVLLLIPLIALVLGTASLYGARAFTELLLAQPIPRRSLFFGLYAGVAVPLASATAIALLAPFLWHRALDPSSAPMLLLMIAVSVMLVALFTSMSFVITVLVRDRARGLGVALLLWLALSVVYDGVVLSVATVLRDWPIERGMLAAMALNPLDLARTALLLQLDVPALMGYTGAMFRAAFGGVSGFAITLGLLALWSAVAWWWGARAFERRDF
jgi:Cu-processing system permease protein